MQTNSATFSDSQPNTHWECELDELNVNVTFLFMHTTLIKYLKPGLLRSESAARRKHFAGESGSLLLPGVDHQQECVLCRAVPRNLTIIFGLDRLFRLQTSGGVSRLGFLLWKKSSTLLCLILRSKHMKHIAIIIRNAKQHVYQEITILLQSQGTI